MLAIARANQHGLLGEGPGKSQPFLRTDQVVAGDGLAGFDVDRQQRLTVLGQDVHFIARPVAPEIEIGRQSPIISALQQLADGPALEQRPAHPGVGSCHNTLLPGGRLGSGGWRRGGPGRGGLSRDGDISQEANKGEGTEFLVELPVGSNEIATYQSG